MKKNLLFVVMLLFAGVTVFAQPAQPADPTVSTNSCGPKILTRAVPPGAAVFYWQGTSCGVLTTDNALTYTANASGTYYLRASESGMWSTCASVIVTVNPIPAIPPVPTESANVYGDKILTRGFPPAGTTYYWQGTACGTDMSNYSMTYTATTTGTYYLAAYTTTGGCWSACNSIAIIYAVGVNANVPKADVKIYPNPIVDKLSINISVLANEEVFYTISNIMGESVSVGSFINKGNQQIDLSSLVNGVYFIKLQNNHLSYSQKIVLAK